jgi:hypothetical protein
MHDQSSLGMFKTLNVESPAVSKKQAPHFRGGGEKSWVVE